MRIIEQIEGHYEVQDVKYGQVYRWHPESVAIECGCCGKRSTLTRSSLIGSPTTCECGKDHSACIREELVFQVPEKDEDLHPWRYQATSQGAGIPF